MVRRQGRNNRPAARGRLGWAGALVLLAAASGLAASAAGASAASRPTSSPVTFSVATYNIHGANRHLPQVVANIRRTKADLVCLQEVNRGASPTLKKHLRGQYPHMVFGLNQVADGFALLARKPITHRGWVPAGRINYHSVLHARTELGGRQVQVVAVHLIPNIPKPRADVGEQWKHVARQERIRNRDVARVAGLFSEDLPVLALGDFNCLSFQGAVTYMASRGFVDSAASVCERPDALYTWRGRFAGRLLHTRIDYIFHTAHFRTLASRVIHEAGSDHFPVVSTLAWAKRQAAGAPQGERG